MDFVTVQLPEKAFLTSPSSGGGTPQPQRVFLAYRMTVSSSIAFHGELRSHLHSLGIVAVDGRVEPGEDWAPTVRKRIKGTKLFVADLTGPSREVLFELGFAGNKDLFPVVETDAQRAQLPRWVTSKQCEHYGDGRTATVADAIARRVSSAKRRAPRPRPSPVPGLLAWVTRRDLFWDVECKHQAQLLCQEAGIDFVEHFEEDFESPEDLLNVLRASVVVGAVDGGRQDYAVHYVLGDVAGRQRAGAGRGRGQSLLRRGYVLVEDGTQSDDVVADSVRRLSNRVVKCTSPRSLRRDLRAAVDSYRNLLKADDE